MSTAEFQRLFLLAAGVDSSQIPAILDTATWRRFTLQALYDLSQGGGGGGGGITDAPSDSKTYGRNNGAWVEANHLPVFGIITGSFVSGDTLASAKVVRNIIIRKNEAEVVASFGYGMLDQYNVYIPVDVSFVGGSFVNKLVVSEVGTNFTFRGVSGMGSIETLEFGYNDDLASIDFASNTGLSSLKTLKFGYGAGNGGTLGLGGLAGLSNLQTLIFDGCGPFDLSNSTGLSSLTSLAIGGVYNSGAFNAGSVTLSDTSGMTALTSLTIAMQGSLDITDVSGFANLTSVTIALTNGFDVRPANIQDTATLLPEAKALLLLNALDQNEIAWDEPFQGTIELKVTGTSTLTAVKASLESKGFTVTLTTP